VSYRYLGNKTRLTSWICSTARELIGHSGRVADLMCGTGSVAEAFAREGYEVVAGDQLYFPCLHARARLLFQDVESFRIQNMNYEETISYLNELQPIPGFFSREYGAGGSPINGRAPRMYFSHRNAGQIDAIREQIKTWRAEDVDPLMCDLLLHDLILATNQVANISGTYGYFQSKLTAASLKPIKLIASQVAPPGRHQVIHGSVFETVGDLKVDLLYLDPPYTKRQYAGNYHIPETIAQEDSPLPVGDGGLRDWASLSSPFCYRRRALEAIDVVMKNSTTKIVMWSYSSDGQVPLGDFQQKLSEYGDVEIRQAHLPRFRSNSGGQGGTVNEYLLICSRPSARI